MTCQRGLCFLAEDMLGEIVLRIPDDHDGRRNAAHLFELFEGAKGWKGSDEHAVFDPGQVLPGAQSENCISICGIKYALRCVERLPIEQR